jgi:hypothetical protein
MNRKIIDVTLASWLITVSLVPSAYCAPSTAAKGTAGTAVARPGTLIDNSGLSDADLKRLSLIEHSHFQKSFEFDPAAKRVKRLELLLTGAGQEGSLKQRLAGIDNLGRKSDGAKSAPPSKFGASQSVTQLELSINKKADSRLDLSTRIANLEKKVFGSAFPNLTIQQRITRLQKIIGTGSSDDIADIAPGMQMQVIPGMPGTLQEFSFSQQLPPGIIFNSPFMSPYSLPNDSGAESDINRHMSEMFDHLNQQLRQLHRRPQGYGQTVPREFSSPGNNYDFSDGLPPIPGMGGKKEKPSLPPYMDPNSI